MTSLTLKEIKEELREEISALKSTLKRLKDEHCGVDKDSGHYGETGKYKMKIDLEVRLDCAVKIYKALVKVRKLK